MIFEHFGFEKYDFHFKKTYDTRGVNPRRFVVVSSDPGLWCAVCGLAVRRRLPKR